MTAEEQWSKQAVYCEKGLNTVIRVKVAVAQKLCESGQPDVIVVSSGGILRRPPLVFKDTFPTVTLASGQNSLQRFLQTAIQTQSIGIPHMDRLKTLCSSAIATFSLAYGMSCSSLAAEPIDFNRDIRPILSGSCFACHGPDEGSREAGLRLDTLAGATEDLGGYAAIAPGSAQASALIERITTDDEDLRMPPSGKGKRLEPAEVERLRAWIDSGAPYAKHWSYIPPVKRDLPKHPSDQWCTNEIDNWILERLMREGLQPSPRADRATLARRVSIALTGLPPTWEEVQAFVNDSRQEAYEVFVDSQLSKPAYGERWARVWLDLARYADSAGYADDPSRTIWAFRDYVITSLNENKPFDQFTIEQIAGDLLENPTDQQLIATAFHRNTMTNNEGGTNDEQFRNEAIVDRVNTTMAVWMGTTIACAQCHTHKYDPITQAEYFQVFDFFNQTQDADRRDESPLLEVWTGEQKKESESLKAELAEVESVLSTQTPELDAALDKWLVEVREEPSWSPLMVSEVRSDQGTLQVEDNRTVRLTGDVPAKATYSVRLPVDGSQAWAAIRLKVPPSHPSNFVLSRVTATWEPNSLQRPQGRFVRVELPGENRFLHLAEIEVFQGGTNIATRGKASQSSTAFEGPANLANDGNTDGNHAAGSVTHTAQEANPWLEIDLQKSEPIDSIVVWNRTDGGAGIQERANGFRVILLDEDRSEIWSSDPQDAPKPNSQFALTGARPIKFLSAISDYAQPNFPAEAALPENPSEAAKDPKSNTGWAIGGGVGTAHELTLVLEKPEVFEDGHIVLSLAQISQFGQHVLREFSFEATSDARATQWAAMSESVRQLVRIPELDPQQREKLAAYFRTVTPDLAEIRSRKAELEGRLSGMRPATTVPIMRDFEESKNRETRVQLRGNYQSLGETVTAGVPAALHPLSENVKPNRLALAQWLVDRNNPLAARVVVNRHWEQIFGVGIVQTSEEFGSQGELPFHPELLDYLSVELMEHHWDLKWLLKKMVMSSAFQQSSAVTPELVDADPDNRLLARGPRFRVSAEMIRDQTLAVAGLLSDKMFGPPVRPPQPSMGLSAAFGSATDWSPSEGEDRYRRAIYTTWRRSNPYPSMATFDAPNREVCTLRRSRTNTPLQALVTMNDPVYVEAAQALARRMAERGSIENQLSHGFESALLRSPTTPELQRLKLVYDDLLKAYAATPEQAVAMATMPLGALPENSDVAHYAALTVVANTILNLDEFLMPR